MFIVAICLATHGRGRAVPHSLESTPIVELALDPKATQREKQIEQRRQILVERHSRSGLKLRAAQRYEASSDALARSYSLAPSTERLHLIGETLQRADLDRAALLIKLRLLQAEPQSAQRDELLDAIAVLRAKLGDPEEDAFEAVTLLRLEQERANQLCQKGRYGDCSALYARIYALKPLPRLLFNIAQADRRAGILDESVIFYHRFLQEAPPSPLRREAAQYIAELSETAFKRPIYKQWWLWTSLLIGASAIVAASVAAKMATQRHDPQTDLGTQRPVFMLTY